MQFKYSLQLCKWQSVHDKSNKSVNKSQRYIVNNFYNSIPLGLLLSSWNWMEDFGLDMNGGFLLSDWEAIIMNITTNKNKKVTSETHIHYHYHIGIILET